jgi:hypothetical protein
MKLDIKIENGSPIIFLTDEVNHNKMVVCYSKAYGHSSADRGYMRSLPKPATPAEVANAWRVLGQYCLIKGE